MPTPPTIGKTYEEGLAILQKSGVKLPDEELKAAQSQSDDLNLTWIDDAGQPDPRPPEWASSLAPIDPLSQSWNPSSDLPDWEPALLPEPPPRSQLPATFPPGSGEQEMVWKRPAAQSSVTKMASELGYGEKAASKWTLPVMGPNAKENALIGLVMGGGSPTGMVAGAIGGAYGGAPGAIAGSAVGRAVESAALSTVRAFSPQFSQADISSYVPEGSGGPHASGGLQQSDRAIHDILSQMAGSMNQMARVGVRDLGEKPDRL